MILSNFDSPASKVYYDYNKDATFYNLLIADKIVITINAVWADLILTDIDTWSESKIHTTFKIIYKRDENAMEVYERFMELSSTIAKIRASKHIDKEGFLLIAYYKKFIKEFKKNLILYREECLVDSNHVRGMLPFIDDGVWKMISIDYAPDSTKEDGLIAPIANTFIEKENFIALDDRFVEMLSSSTFETCEGKDCDFIKIPLWVFPPFGDISYQQIKFTRDNLHPGMLKFKMLLNEMADQLTNITFSAENFKQIKQLYNDKLNEHIQPVQSMINESLYINQLKNSSKENTGYRFCLGIASAETLVNIFEKTETIQPYVASEIKCQLQRHFNLTSCHVFSFLENLASVD
jgi:hypothetical protein